MVKKGYSLTLHPLGYFTRWLPTCENLPPPSRPLNIEVHSFLYNTKLNQSQEINDIPFV